MSLVDPSYLSISNIHSQISAAEPLQSTIYNYTIGRSIIHTHIYIYLHPSAAEPVRQGEGGGLPGRGAAQGRDPAVGILGGAAGNIFNNSPLPPVHRVSFSRPAACMGCLPAFFARPTAAHATTHKNTHKNRYLEAFPDSGGFFQGKNFVFDERVGPNGCIYHTQPKSSRRLPPSRFPPQTQ